MKQPRPDLTAVSAIDWARLAAYIDGEGCIGIRSRVRTQATTVARSRQEFIRVHVTNTSVRLLDWIQTTFGGSVGPNRRTAGHKQAFAWTVGSLHAAEVLQHCLPYFIIKKEQAELCLLMQSTMKRWGVKGTPAEVAVRRDEIRAKVHVLNRRGAA